MKPTNSKLKFAALCRVSTEPQAKKGESLKVQKATIEDAVKTIGGAITEWYGGAEHATEGHERKEVDRLLADAGKGRFNAFIVAHPDRWSRDNKKSGEGLKVFSKHNVRFFVGGVEYSLFDPNQLLYLEMSSVIGGYQARSQKKRSMQSRLSRANRGLPACKIPYGRTFDTGKWGIDESKRIIIEDAAQRYLAGEKLSKLADEYGMSLANLHKVLTKRSGTAWEQTFNSDEFNIHATVHTTIPRLLPEKVIKAIKEKSAANKTYTHGHSKYKYLLSRMVFCSHCDYALFGQTNYKQYRYYRHKKTDKKRRQCPQAKGWIVADQLEDIVMRHLFECFGNPAKVEAAIQKAIPNLEKIKESQKRIERIAGELEKITKGRDRIIHLVGKDQITDSQAEKELAAMKEKEERLQTERDRLGDSIQDLPDADKVKSVSKKVSGQFRRHTDAKLVAEKRQIAHDYAGMSWEEKRKLLETVFSGKTPEGKRLGVYITWDDEKGWKFDIKGHLIDERGLLPLSDSMKAAYFGENKTYVSVEK